jgi:signal transduction histidine kinase
VPSTQATIASWGDELLAAGLLVVAATELIGSDVHFNRPVALSAAVPITAAVALRRRAPLGGLVMLLAAYVAHRLAVGVPAPGLADPPYSFALAAAWLICVYSVAAYTDRVRALAGLLLTVLTAVGFTVSGKGPLVLNDVIAAILLSAAVPWLAGLARGRHLAGIGAREEAAALRLARSEAEAEAVATERTRIARELHDIVAHGLSVVVVQASAERRHLGADHQQTADVLGTIEDAGRAALSELRRLLGVLRAHGDPLLTPPPRLEDLKEVVASVNRSGLATTLYVEGPVTDLPAGLELSAYRVAQEALTNVVKHAHASQAVVTLRYLPHHLEVDVVDDGTAAVAATRTGFGLVGASERVALFDGTFAAAPLATGGFRVLARFPIART